MAESVGRLGAASQYDHNYMVSAAASQLRLSFENSEYVYEDTGVDRIELTPGAASRCRIGVRPNIARCPVPALFVGFALNTYIETSDDDDHIVLDSSLPPILRSDKSIRVQTRGGADTIVQPGPAVAWRVDGGDGYDTFVGGSGDDAFEGGAGNDSFSGGRGADRFNGGDGVDQISYLNEGRTSGVRVNLSDSSVKSGSPGLWDGDGDSLGGVEEAVGTPYTDVITGSAGDDYLFGEGGSDRIDGLGGNDEIWAPGGPSWVDGGDGNDTIHAKNSAKDFLSCGAGTDTVFLDSSETFVPFSACETLKP